jgi:Ca2+-binding RTX toxin-like protein
MKRRLAGRGRLVALRQRFLQSLRQGSDWSPSMREPRGARRHFAFEPLEERRLLAAMVAVTDSNQLLFFDSATPGTIQQTLPIVGLGIQEKIEAIDVRPATGALYGLGITDQGLNRAGQLYHITMAGVATAVGIPFGLALSDTELWGMDFNPVTDQLRVTSSATDNLRLDPNDGSLIATDTPLSSGSVDAIAYDRNTLGNSATTLFGYNWVTDQVVRIGGVDGVPSPNNGIVTNVGPSGIFTNLGEVGFDIDTAGVARLSANLIGGNYALHTLNLTTGAGTLVGNIGSGTIPINALTSLSPRITILGTATDDTLVVTITGPNSGTYSLNGATPVPFLAADSFSFLGAGGLDTLTILGTDGADLFRVLGNGDVNVTGSFDFQGSQYENLVIGGRAGDDLVTVDVGPFGLLPFPLIFDGMGGRDRLTLQGTPAGVTIDQVRYLPGAEVTAGRLTYAALGGAPSMVVDFLNLEPVVDVIPAASLLVQGTNASNSMQLKDSPAPGQGRVSIDGFETLDFSNKTTLILDGADGDDQVSLQLGVVPDGLTGITVQGGQPLANDTLVVQGRLGANDSLRLAPSATGSGTLNGSAIPLAFSGIENLQLQLQAADQDSFTVDGTVGDDIYRVQSGPERGQFHISGLMNQGLTPFALPSIAVRQNSNTVVGTYNFNGAGGSDTFILTTTGSDDAVDVLPTLGNSVSIVHEVNGIATNFIGITNLSSLIVDTLDGDDTVTTGMNLPITLGVHGGNPSTGSDILNLNASGTVANLVTLDYAAASARETSFLPVNFTGFETVNLNAASHDLLMRATPGDDALSITPTGPNALTARLLAASPAISAPLVNALGIGSFEADLLGGSDRLQVYASQQAEEIGVTDMLVTIDEIGPPLALQPVIYAGTEQLEVFGQAGSDNFQVAPSAATGYFIDGGNPIGIAGDKLTVVGPVDLYLPGTDSDEGAFQVGTNPLISFDHIEAVIVDGGMCAIIGGTQADDDITVIARDASTHPGADGVQDFTVSVNGGLPVLYLNVAKLGIDAQAGDDDIVIRTPAPNDAAWNVQLSIVGGSPSIGEATEADRVVLETPLADTLVFTPTGPDTGTLSIDGGLGGLIQLLSILPADFCPGLTYVSSVGGVEWVQYDGELSGAGTASDSLVIQGTAANDITEVHAASSGRGSFLSSLSPRFEFQSLATLTVQGGVGGYDQVTILGTDGDDAFTSPAPDKVALALGMTVQLPAGSVERIEVRGLEGNDSIVLGLTDAGLGKFVDAGGGNDVVDLSASIDAVIYGGDGDDVLIGSPASDTIFGGRGNDAMVGLAGNDTLYGEEGNDLLGNLTPTPNGIADDAGSDTFYGGTGSDLFFWEPGDGNDILEGGAGEADGLLFFGGAGAEVFNVFAKPNDPARAILFRSTGNITIDMAGVDQIQVTGNAGADRYVVGRANDGDAGDDIATTNPYTDPTATLSDLSTTEVRVVTISEGADAGDFVFVDGRSLDDDLTLTVENAGLGSLRLVGLPFDIRITGANTADLFTLRGNHGHDQLKAAAGVEAAIGITLAGGQGHDRLSADAILIGGPGDDFLEGGAGDDQLFGNEGEDTFVGGGGNDTIDGGDGLDTIRVVGTSGNDAIAIFQTAANTLVHTVNGNVQTDTLALAAGTRTVERVEVLAGSGDDTIQVNWADSLAVDANLNSLRVDVDGGLGATSDRLGVVDSGPGDLILYQRGTTDDTGTMTIGPGNAEPLVATFIGIEYAQPVAAPDGDIVVFKHDPLEFNNRRSLATYLGAGDALNVDPNINPGLDPIFGLAGDEDWYRVVAERTGVLDFQVYFRQLATLASGRPALPNAGNLEIDVTDSSGNLVVGFGTNDANDNERIRIPAIAGQTYYLRVYASGSAINTYDITVDQYDPPRPFDLELLDNPAGDPPPANSDTGRSRFDNVTRDATPTIVFRLEDALFLNDLPGNDAAGSPPDQVIPIGFQAAAGVAGYRVAVFDEGSSPPPGTQTGTAPQTPLGFATFVAPGVYQFTAPSLNDGSHFLTARVQMVDPANPQQTGFGPRSNALEIVVDTVSPPGFFGQLNQADTTQGLAAVSDSGVSGVPNTFADRVTNVTQPTFYGRAEADAIVRLYAETNGVAGLQSSGASPDLWLGLTTSLPVDGSDQFPGGQWSLTSMLDLNNPALGFALDGLRSIYMTAEDVAGNVTPDAEADRLNIFLDTAGPQVTGVQITGSPAFNLFGLKPENALQGPTPAVESLTIRLRDLPSRSNADPNFLYAALVASIAVTPGNLIVRGDHSGIIAVQAISLVSDPTANGSPATASLRLDFFEPLPDDRYTLTILDNLVDPVGNRLDGESNAAEPNSGPLFPSGDRQPGTNFVARFTVDSRPEIGTVSQGLIYVDINGNLIFDPEGQDNDATNRDFVYQFGSVTDGHFAGNFANRNTGIASGYDKLGVYGRFQGSYSFMLDTDDDGVGDVASLMPGQYQVNGIPVAGNFSAARDGDEIGLFDGSFWYLDLNGNNQIDVGERLASNANGLPVVGDFNGDGNDDLALFNNDTNTFRFDLNRDGVVDDSWAVRDDIARFVGLSGFTDKPIAGDLNLDGIDDLGLWVKARQGVIPEKTGEFFFWVSDTPAALPSAVFEAYSPAPLGNDLFAHFGNEVALPVFGNFDPPVTPSAASGGSGLTNLLDPADVNRDGEVTPIDVLVVINSLRRDTLTSVGQQAVRLLATNGGMYLDVSGDGAVSPIDVLQVINTIQRRSGSSGEGEAVDRALSNLYAPPPSAWDEALAISNWAEEIRRKRG